MHGDGEAAAGVDSPNSASNKVSCAESSSSGHSPSSGRIVVTSVETHVGSVLSDVISTPPPR